MSSSETSTALENQRAGVLFADIDTRSPEELSILEQIHHDNPDLRIILTYLAPPEDEKWETRACESADIVIRKPYGLVDVDRVIRTWDDTDSRQP